MTFRLSTQYCYVFQAAYGMTNTAMADSLSEHRRRPALIPKDATLGPEDIWSICARTGHAIIPPPEPPSAQQTATSQKDSTQAALDTAQRGTKRKASTSDDPTYEATPSNTHA
jgi:hypothetical protein